MDEFADPPDPGSARTFDELAGLLQNLRIWAGEPSFETIKSRVNASWRDAGRPADERAGTTTIKACFMPGRHRLNADLVISVVATLHNEPGYIAQWRQALAVLGGEVAPAAQIRVQSTLPADPPEFVGRSRELTRLRRLQERAVHGSNAVAVIDGMAGVGKTQLAIHAGHLLHTKRPFDTVLFVNLRGFHPDPNQPPADPAAVLDGFLRVLGVDGRQIPHRLSERIERYRRTLAGRTVLVILDDAADEAQVQPLLVSRPGCMTLVTSRRRLSGLRPTLTLSLSVLSPTEAARYLLRSGAPVGADPDAPVRVAERCGNLPLALGVVAGQLRDRPGWTITDHADRLDEHQRRGRIDSDISATLDESYRRLPSEQQRLLRVLALHPGPDIEPRAAAALADLEAASVDRDLRLLLRDNLLQSTASGRYTLHGLVRVHAAGLAHDEDPPPAHRAALSRLLDYYLATAAAATSVLFPAERHRRRHLSPPASAYRAPVVDAASARAWLDEERAGLITATGYAVAHGWPEHTIRLSTFLYRYLAGGHTTAADTVHANAKRAAQQIGDRAAEADALIGLGGVALHTGRFADAVTLSEQALDAVRALDTAPAHDGVPTSDAVPAPGRPHAEARALRMLGNAEMWLGRYGPALDHCRQALDLDRRADNPIGEADTLSTLGALAERAGRTEEAAKHLELARDRYRHVGDKDGEAMMLNNLGDVAWRGDEYHTAADHFRQALALFEQLGDRSNKAWTLTSLGTVVTRLRRTDHATELHLRALAIFDAIGARDGPAWAHNGIGEAAHTEGRHAEALDRHTTAHAVATEVGARDQIARADAGLARAHRALGNVRAACHHLRRALIEYTRLGAPDAASVRAELTELGCPDSG